MRWKKKQENISLDLLQLSVFSIVGWATGPSYEDLLDVDVDNAEYASQNQQSAFNLPSKHFVFVLFQIDMIGSREFC